MYSLYYIYMSTLKATVFLLSALSFFICLKVTQGKLIFIPLDFSLWLKWNIRSLLYPWSGIVFQLLYAFFFEINSYMLNYIVRRLLWRGDITMVHTSPYLSCFSLPLDKIFLYMWIYKTPQVPHMNLSWSSQIAQAFCSYEIMTVFPMDCFSLHEV